MPGLPKLELITGQVIDVQLTAEKVDLDKHAKRAEDENVSNQMRLFLKCADGKERDYDFQDSQMGVRKEHEVAIIRGQRGKADAPVNLILVNKSRSEREEYPAGFKALHRAPFLGPVSKASILTALLLIFAIALISVHIVASIPPLYWLAFVAIFGIALGAFWLRERPDTQLKRANDLIRQEATKLIGAPLPALDRKD